MAAMAYSHSSEDGLHDAAEASFSSELTSLSQLSAMEQSSAVKPLPRKTSKTSTTTTTSLLQSMLDGLDSDSDGEGLEQGNAEAADSGFADRQSIQDILRMVDKEYGSDMGSSPARPVRPAKAPFMKTNIVDTANDRTRDVLARSPSPIPLNLGDVSSIDKSATPPARALSRSSTPVITEDAQQTASSPSPIASHNFTKKPIRAIYDSEEEDAASAIKRVSVVGSNHDDDQDELPTLAQIAARSNSESPVIIRKKTAKTALFRADSDSSSEDDDRTQRQVSEEIEQFADASFNKSSARKGPTAKKGKPDAEGKEDAVKQEKKPKIKKLSKKETEEMHKESERINRRQVCYIDKVSRPPKPLSEIIKKIHGGAKRSSGPLFGTLPFSSTSTSLVSTDFSRQHSVSAVARDSSHAAGLSSTASKPILIGSSSAILDATSFDDQQDSYDTRFLNNIESQSQSEQSMQASTSKAMDAKIDEMVQLRSVPMTKPPEADEDDDDDLPDLAVIIARDTMALKLRQRKAALIARQLDSNTVKKDTKGKGKMGASGLNEPTAYHNDPISLDADEDSDLEICEPALFKAPFAIKKDTTPRNTAKHGRKASTHGPQSSAYHSRMEGRSIKREESFASESQFHRAGRTFGAIGGERTTVDPHVVDSLRLGSKANRQQVVGPSTSAVPAHSRVEKRAGGRHATSVSKKAQDILLLGKAARQAKEDRDKRIDDWQRRGGTLREANDAAGSAPVAEGAISAAQEDANRAELTKDIMMQIRQDAEDAVEAEEEDDDEEDGDYVGSGEEREPADADVGSADEWGSADEAAAVASASDDEDQAGSDSNAGDEGATSVHDMAEEAAHANGNALEQVANLDRSGQTENDTEEGEEIFRRPVLSKRQAILDDDDEDEEMISRPHDGQTFPIYDGEMRDISLTQALGSIGDTRVGPQASHAVFAEGEGFSQMFADGSAGDFSQMMTQTQVVGTANLPQMFRKDAIADTPQIRRHAIGEVPIVLDAALRDAQVRQEADLAYEEEQQRRVLMAEQAAQIARLNATPGSTVSGELSPMAPLSENLSRYASRPTTPASNDLSDGEMLPDEQNDLVADTPIVPRRLIRAGDQMTMALSSPDPDDADSEDDNVPDSVPLSKAMNAFDILKKGQQQLQKPKVKKAANEYLAEQADESEDEDMFTALRKAADGEEEEETSDLDGELDGLVNDETVAKEEKEEQDKLAMEKHKEHVQADEAKVQKRVERIVAGQDRRSKRGADGLLSDSDYEDDEAGFHRKAKVKKARKFDKVLEGLAANPRTNAFAASLTDLDGVSASQNKESQYLGDENLLSLPSSDMGDQDTEDDDEVDEVMEDSYHRRPKQPERERTPELQTLERLIWLNSPSSDIESQVVDRFAIHATTNRVTKHKHDDFADLDTQYTIGQTESFTRKVILLEKDEQNDRGVGPGRTSAVTGFVLRNQKGQKHNVSTSTVVPVVGSTFKSKAASQQPVNQSVSGKGRLAMARQSSKAF